MGYKMNGFSGFGHSPVKQTTEVDPNKEAKAQDAKAEDEGQQIIGRVDRGEITQEEGNKLLSDLQDLQVKPK